MSCLANRGIRGILKKDIGTIWQEVEPILSRAIRSDHFNMIDIYMLLQKGQMQLWVGENNGKIEAVMTTEIIIYPQCKECVLVHMAGNWDDGFKSYLDYIKEWAKTNNCSKIIIEGREGWQRLLKDFFKKTAIRLEMKI